MAHQINTIETIMDDVDDHGKKAIYVSYPCIDDNEYDYLLIEDIEQIRLKPTTDIQYVDYTQGNQIAYLNDEMLYQICYDEDNDPTNVYIKAIFNNAESISNAIVLQDFADAVARKCYTNTQIDLNPYIMEAKHSAFNNLKDHLFVTRGILLENKSYDVVTMFIDNNDHKFMLSNKLGVTEMDDGLVLEFFGCVSYMPLKDVEVKEIIINTGQVSIRINDYAILNSNDGFIKQYGIKVLKMDVQQSIEQPIELPLTESDDSYFDEASLLLADRAVLFNIDNNDDVVQDIFDDFDFDF